MSTRAGAHLLLSCLPAVLLAGCWSESANEVVVYTALDREFSEPVFEEFTAKTGVTVLPKFDTESTKTVGLTQAILAERDRPRCDVFWNNEILNTLRLQNEGLLTAYVPSIAEQFPAMVRSPKGYWHGLAGRARVLIVNTDLVPEGERPTSIFDLVDARRRGRAAMAKPLFGTTATHAACLFAHWGEDRAKQFFDRVKANDVQILSGNKQVALAVAAGEVAFGTTDTDDAIIEVEKGMPVAIVYPDQAAVPGETDDPLGTLFIPNTVSILEDCAHREAAEQLVAYLLSPEVEARLAAGPSAQIPLNPNVQAELRTETPQTVRAMQVDFEQAAQAWDTAATYLREKFAGAE